MNAPDINPVSRSVALTSAITSACDSIAPSWPLDQFIAVNPYWGHIDQPFETVGANLTRVCGSRLSMPLDYYRDAFQRGEIEPQHLTRALAEAGSAPTPTELLAAIAGGDETPQSLPLLSDTHDALRDLSHEPAWCDAIAQQMTQFCAAWFDTDQADWGPARSDGLYARWRAAIAAEHAVELLMHAPEVHRRAQRLPATTAEVFEQITTALEVPAAQLDDLFQVALARVNGWAAWCAYLRWQARLTGGDDDNIVDLLAIRLAWELLLDDGAREPGSAWARWQAAWSATPAGGAAARTEVGALWQRAHEIAYQESLVAALAAPAESPPVEVAAQAVFCIDVRSEVFRRALERAEPAVQTLGFAGFFGLPIAYTPIGTSARRPQLPGLLAPALETTDSCGVAHLDHTLAEARRTRLAVEESWQPFKRLPGAAFTLVETLGLGYLSKLVRRSLPRSGGSVAAAQPGLEGDAAARLRPCLVAGDDGSVAERAALAEGVLGAMSLGAGLARVVLLVGHGSRSANNAHAAGLDCGACCGQTGEVNARALAELLNDAAVRDAVRERGLDIPETTWFVPALHDTTSDDVVIFDRDLVPASHDADLTRLEQSLERAGDFARAERAPALGLAALAGQPGRLAAAVRGRANDWAQTRPEWGLANNAAFIVAPRARSRGIDLAGRSFLHDYNHEQDSDGSVLELIMTAPMIVTHWINMQYHASTVDNARYGSGNKLLHNVVGGRIGVFEGNGGDLRIGLPLQSVHDGKRFMHAPLRLSVFIAAPRAAIDTVIANHALVRQLLDNRWLYLYRLDDEQVEGYADGEWSRCEVDVGVASAA